MLSRSQFSDQVVVPALQRVGLYSKSAEQLVLGTALVESRLTWLVQLGSGPAKGLFQVEPFTLKDLYKRTLPNPKYEIIDMKLAQLELPDIPREIQLVFNLWYAAAICRILYYRHSEPLPAADDIQGHANYWKKYYNTSAGKGNPQNYIDAWSGSEMHIA